MIVQLILLAAILFLSAGTLYWVMGWAVIVLYTLVMIATIIFIQVDPEFLEHRIKIDEKTKGWDKLIAGILRLISPVGILIVAGLELRFGLAPRLPVVVQVLGLIVTAIGYGIGIWAVVMNKFYAGFVRIDEDHTVVKDGPYRYIRHPGYAGSVLVQISLPVALGSRWTLLLGILGSCLIIIRTHFEDRALIRELAGYDQYAAGVVFRLFPGIW